MNMKWKEDEINGAILMLKSGFTFEKIGLNLNRTTKSVKVRLNKLGFKYRNCSKETNYEIKKCLKCNVEYSSLKSENRKFCSSSCSANYNNSLREKKIKRNEQKRKAYKKRQKNQCLYCTNITTNIFCNSSCQSSYRKKIIEQRIENGDTSLNVKQYKKYLIEKYGEKCMECEWNRIHPITGKVPIELEHIDGDSENNRLDNLKILCPNCHSLTPTYKALNMGNGRAKRRERYKEGKSY